MVNFPVGRPGACRNRQAPFVLNPAPSPGVPRSPVPGGCRQAGRRGRAEDPPPTALGRRLGPLRDPDTCRGPPRPRVAGLPLFADPYRARGSGHGRGRAGGSGRPAAFRGARFAAAGRRAVAASASVLRKSPESPGIQRLTGLRILLWPVPALSEIPRLFGTPVAVRGAPGRLRRREPAGRIAAPSPREDCGRSSRSMPAAQAVPSNRRPPTELGMRESAVERAERPSRSQPRHLRVIALHPLCGHLLPLTRNPIGGIRLWFRASTL
ncbi:hypothetical protein ACVIWV_007280 [Bradyrhizobium diazoefficiens]